MTKRAYTERRPVLDFTEEMTGPGRAEFAALLDAVAFTTNVN